MDDEKMLKKMAELLLSKATMLQYHCAECKLPLFEKEGKIFCPRCGEFRAEKERAAAPPAQKIAAPKESATRRALAKKRAELLKRLNKEKNPKKISELLEAIEKLEKMLSCC